MGIKGESLDGRTYLCLSIVTEVIFRDIKICVIHPIKSVIELQQRFKSLQFQKCVNQSILKIVFSIVFDFDHLRSMFEIFMIQQRFLTLVGPSKALGEYVKNLEATVPHAYTF